MVVVEELIMKPALLIVDIQNDFFEISPTTVQSLNAAIQYINAAITLFREKQLPIFCIQHMNPKDKLIPGEVCFDVPDQLAVLPSDEHIHKTYGNAFKQTPLLEKLQELAVDTVLVTGFCAEHCVLSTYRGAKDLDLTPIMLRDALASDKPDNIPFVESISDIISIGALRHILA
jgi:nicotinamidase-related amidase